MRYCVLGPLSVLDAEDEEVDLGGPRQRAVLARLLVSRGRVVPADRLVADLWNGEPPPRALGALQAYVSHLRRALEPDRAPRSPATTLVSVPPGYALRAAADDIDARVFEAELSAAAQAADPRDALALLDKALGRWRGPAYAGMATEPWAQPEAVRLTELRDHARERHAAALLDSGQPAAAVADLESLVAVQPLREESWRLLALALYRDGRQGDALAALRRARAILDQELGVRPGPVLRELEAAILRHDASLAARVPTVAAVGIGQPGMAASAATPTGAVIAIPGQRANEPAEGAGWAEIKVGIVGRDAELAKLRAGADTVLLTGIPRLALVSGEAGIGKTELVATLADGLAKAGWRTAFGRFPEAEWLPALWPLIELTRGLVADFSPTDAERAAAAPLRDMTAADDLAGAAERFRMHEGLASYLARFSHQTPLLVVLDDLHQADEGSLAALRDVVALLPEGRLLIIGTYRDDEVGPGLRETLAVISRHQAARIGLTGLALDDVAAVVRAVSASEGVLAVPSDDVVAAIADRTGGNPLFVRESARLLAGEGELVAMSEVPAGVRDVIRRRIDRLPHRARLVLRTASALGQRAAIDVLVEAGDFTEDEVYDALEAALVSGVLTEPAVGVVAFSHALVRDTLYDDLSKLRRARIHTRLGIALERLQPDDPAALAHHFGEAASLGYAERTERYARAAAQQAESRFAYTMAMDLWQRAADACTTRRMDEAPRNRVEILAGLARAQQLAGRCQTARFTRNEAVKASVALGDAELTARAIVSTDVPMLWNAKEYGTVDDELVGIIRDTLDALPHDDSPLRCRLLAIFSTEVAFWAGVDATVPAHDAVAMARRLGDPALLAVALNSQYYTLRAPQTRTIALPVAEELWRLGRDRGMPGVEVLGLLGQVTELGLYGRVDEAADLVDAAEALVKQFELPIFSVQVELFRAYRDAVQGDLNEAAAAFIRIGKLSEGAEMWDLPAITAYGAMVARYQQGRILEQAPVVEGLARAYPRSAGPSLAALWIAQGDQRAAADVLVNAPPLPYDYLWLLQSTMRADAVVTTAPVLPRVMVEQAYADLLPFADLVAGGETLSIVIGPVATRLARLAEALSRDGYAKEHWEQAVEVARRARSARWEAEAMAGLRPFTRT